MYNIENMIRSLRFDGVWWLAGYPRSGAALVRSILANCFDLTTGSIYQEERLGKAYAKNVNLWEHPSSEEDVLKLLDNVPLTVKTHELPEPGDSTPTIIIVRDGRRVFESLKAFYSEGCNRDYKMGYLITGMHLWGCWSRWHRMWATHTGPATLWLKYESIMADLPKAVDRIGKHLSITPKRYEIPSFDQISKETPTIFRKAEVDGNGGLTEEEEEVFWYVHGSVMGMLGYER